MEEVDQHAPLETIEYCDTVNEVIFHGPKNDKQ